MDIQTTEELFKEYSNLCQFEEGSPEYLVDKQDFQKALVEFAKSHVETALKKAYDSIEYTTEDSSVPYVVEKSIIDCYPLTNIK